MAIGIGGSYLGPEFVHEALRMDKAANEAARGRSLHFLANVDPVDVSRVRCGCGCCCTGGVCVDVFCSIARLLSCLAKSLANEAIEKSVESFQTHSVVYVRPVSRQRFSRNPEPTRHNNLFTFQLVPTRSFDGFDRVVLVG